MAATLEKTAFATPILETHMEARKGINWLGSPYNCSSNELGPLKNRDDVEIFPPGNENLQTLPIGTLKYNLNHIKDTKDKTQTLGIGLDIKAVILGIKLSIGSAQFDTAYNSKMETDHLQVIYYREDYVDRLLPSVSVNKKINDAFSSAAMTHVVSEVTYGVHMVADILITTKTTTKMVNKSASGLGMLVIGPISAGIEAAMKAVLDMNPDEADVKVEVTSTHFQTDFKEVKTATQLFQLLKKLDTVPADTANELLKPFPLKMFCVPIRQFLEDIGEDPAETKTSIVSIYLLEPLNEMLETLRNFVAVNEVTRRAILIAESPPSFMAKKVLEGDFRLSVLLKDEYSQLSQCIALCEKENYNKAKILFDAAVTLLEGVKEGLTTDAEIEAQLVRYNKDFNMQAIQEKIEGFIRTGKKELSLVNNDDVTSETDVQFFGSLVKFQEAMQTPATWTVALSMETKEDAVPAGREETIGGDRGKVFVSLYDVTSKLDVFVLMPSASSQFALNVHFSPTDKLTFTDVSKIRLVLDILHAAYGASVSPSSKFYTAVAASENIAFPFLRTDNVKTHLTNALINWPEKYGKVEMLPTFMTLKSYLAHTERGTKKIVCLPTSSFVPLTLGFAAFNTLLDEIPKEKLAEYEFVAGEFDLGEDDGPLLLIFQEGQLKAASLDWLDFLYLKDALEKDQLEDLRTKRSTFFPSRLEMFFQLEKLFQFSLAQKTNLVQHPLVLDIDGPSEPDGPRTTKLVKIETAIGVCSAYLSSCSVERMVNVLTRKLLEVTPSAGYFLEKQLRWSSTAGRFLSSKIFEMSQRHNLRAPFLTLLFQQSPSLRRLSALHHTTTFAIQAKRALGIKANPDAFTHLKDFVKTTIFTDDLNKIAPDAVKEIQAKVIDSMTLENAIEVLRIIQNKMIINDAFAPDSNDAVPLLQGILSVLTPPEEVIPTYAKKPDPPKSRAASAVSRKLQTLEDEATNFFSIAKKFVDQVVAIEDLLTDEEKTLVDKNLTAKLLLPIVDLFGNVRYPKWHRSISTSFLNLKDLKEIEKFYEGLVAIVTSLKTTLGVTSTYNELHFVWSNPPFESGIFDACTHPHDKTFIRGVVAAVVEKLDESASYAPIPPYIPTRIARSLRAFLILEGLESTSRPSKHNKVTPQFNHQLH